ncbi:hypothetical protein AB205_0098290 [Aquarana catesbeiana]|uniref:Uncharacterized protein n=1 Tax=Aquarana catesbeiana TaxID=8400 RepID=A0A2G9QBX2_AQUCT|nr:hypothetical protein AB205_0098290 [Aquarana catesbeiana]
MTWDSNDEGKYKAYMNILIWLCFWTFIFFVLIVFFLSTGRHKKDTPAKPPQGMKGGYPRSGPTGEATRPSSPQKQKHPACSMLESTSQEQTLTSDQVQEESECGQLTQDISLEPWDLSPGPSTDIVIVDVKSPDASHSEGQGEPEEEESIREPLVCQIMIFHDVLLAERVQICCII